MKSRLLGAVCACALTLVTSVSQAVSLQNGDILSFTTIAGSQVSGIGAGGQAFDSATLDSFNGLIIGTAQPSIPGIDQTWASMDFGITGNHRTSSGVTVINDTTLDFSGWIMTVGGEDYAFGATQNVANYNFDGTNFTLSYSWTGSALGSLGVTEYDLILNGTVSSVPVPAAAWLFGSGLLGLVGIARRKKSA